MRTIALEEHFVTPTWMNGPGKMIGPLIQHVWGPEGADDLFQRLGDFGEGRVAAMNAAGIDLQILSLGGGIEQLEPQEAVAIATDANDLLACAVDAHSTRFAAFAALPTPTPEKAADELERAVRSLGFRGALINGHSRGRYLDDEAFWPILERAEALDVPVYLHPTPPPMAVIEASYMGNYAPEVGLIFATAGFGWHIDTAVHAVRLILSGAFDRYPRLQLIVGHMGEGLPVMMPRLNEFLSHVANLDRSMSEYFVQNLHYTFSAFNWNAAFLSLLDQVGVDRIMFATDYPFGSLSEARTFLEKIPVSQAEREQIAHGNAERLFGV